MQLSILGEDPRLRYCKEYLISGGELAFGKILLTPIPTTLDGITVKGSSTPLCEIPELLTGKDALVCYGLPRSIKSRLLPMGVTVADVDGDEQFLEDNARLTAIGAVGRILTEEIAAPSELSIGVIGYGRIGRRLVDIFAYLGARIRVFTSKRELSRELSMLGISGVDSTSLEGADGDCFSGLDILLNTAPAMLIPERMREALFGVRVIELASGSNFPRGIIYEKFASVPAEMFPKSAGFTLGRAACRLLG